MPIVPQRPLPSGRYRAYAWNRIAQKRELVKNPAPGSRGTWSSWAQAHAAAVRRERELDGIYTEAGVEVVRHRRRVPFAEAADLWLKGKRGTTQSRRTIRADVRVLKRTFGAWMITEITEDMILEASVGWQTDNRSASTCARRIVWLGQIMRRAIREGYRDDDPTRDVKIRVRKGRPRPVDEQTLQPVLDKLPVWFRPAAVLAYETGMRAAEIAGLRWLQLRLDGPQPAVTVQDVMQVDRTLRNYTKSGENSMRVVPLSPKAVAALRALREWRGGSEAETDYVVRNTRNRPLLPCYPSMLMKAASRAAGLTAGESVTFHRLRHSCGTNLARRGASAMVIKKVLGHESLATSQIYIDEEAVDATPFFREPDDTPRLRAVDGGPAAGSGLPEKDEQAS